jgi:hypothetical protein
MPVLQGVNAQIAINVADRFIPEGANSWANNWLQAEIAVKRFDEDYEVSFCTRVLTVHDLYDLYFHLGIVLQGLSKFGVLISLIERQIDVKIMDSQKAYQVELALGQESLEMDVEPANLARFARELRLLLNNYPLRSEEFPSVAPIVEFYSTRHSGDGLRPRGLMGWLWSWFWVRNPVGDGVGDALRMAFTLSTPGPGISDESIECFFAARGYDVHRDGNGLIAQRGSAWGYVSSLDPRRLLTKVAFSASDTHSLLTVDVWTAGVRQNRRKLFAWVGEASMLEVLLAGGRSLSFVQERLDNMDSNLHRLNLRKAVVNTGGLLAVIALTALLVQLLF